MIFVIVLISRYEATDWLFQSTWQKLHRLARPDGVVNFKAFRTGEMYLIRAEAYARKGGVNEVLALADLNTLRAARIAGFVAGAETGAALIDAIALERRKELISEGHRWFDLKRTTKTINRTNCTVFCTLTSIKPCMDMADTRG